MMAVEHLEVLVEEPSMEVVLRRILPTLLGHITFAIRSFQGKKDLLLKLHSRMQGYSRYIPSTWRVIVIVDRDDDDCGELKDRLESAAISANLVTRSSAVTSQYQVVNRIAIEELESWYFGDWNAVVQAYPRLPTEIVNKAAFRMPDAIKGGTWEAFERVTQRYGYFKGGLRKIEAASEIASRMNLEANTSTSFNCLLRAIREIAAH